MAILVSEAFRDLYPRYHTAGDQLQSLDMPCFAGLVKASVATFVDLSDCRVRSTYLAVVARDG